MATTESTRQLTDQQAEARGLDTSFVWTERLYDGDTQGMSLEAVPKPGTAVANENDVRASLLAVRASVKAGIDAARADRQAWAGMTANQKDRANRDSLDREVQQGKTMLDVLRVLLDDFSAGPEV